MSTQVAPVSKKKPGPGASFGARLRSLREAKGMTVVTLAEAIGTTHQAISRLERGEVEPKWSTVLKLADALGVDASEFQGDDKPKK